MKYVKYVATITCLIVASITIDALTGIETDILCGWFAAFIAIRLGVISVEKK